ncbi:MAG: choice-of-anchor A family protein [Gorillibacterium sp.]|nr:choice-of-anchor A family protein [Gorillibacterium sp.]
MRKSRMHASLLLVLIVLFTFHLEATAAEEVVPYTLTPELGIAGHFNAFILGDFTQSNGQISGRLAASGNIRLVEYEVGGAFKRSTSGDVLISGQNLTLANGILYGSAIYGGELSVTNATYSEAVIQGTPIDFVMERQNLLALSSKLSYYSYTENAEYEAGELLLKATEPFNVIQLSASDLANASGLRIQVPETSTLIVNVSGTNISIQNLHIGDAKPNRILFNFYDATSITISNTTFQGSILAPQADVFFSGAELDGMLIAKSFMGSGQLKNDLFQGSIWNSIIENSINFAIGPASNFPSPKSIATPLRSPDPTPTPIQAPTDETVEVDDSQVPLGQPIVPGSSPVVNEEVPIDLLPTTGETSKLPMYLLGAVIIAVGILLARMSMKRTRR